jgi:hypothetical protein
LLSTHQHLRRIDFTIASLNKRCAEMRQHVAAARHDNAPILEDATTLMAQRQDLTYKSELLRAFNRHFIISENDLGILTTNAESVDDNFFRVLTRIKQIHHDCQVLLGADNQRLGLELMESNSRHLNTAYQKLYRWILCEFKTVNFENPQISSTIRRGLRALAERPALFQSCLDFFAESREHVLLDAFYTALTGPSDDSHHDQATKPIDFNAHDALRYVGDMLAWSHSAAVSEREAFESLAATDGDEIAKGIKAGTESAPWTVIDGEAFDGRAALEQLASRNLNGVLRVLRQRVEQVIHNQDDAVLTYKLMNLFSFYRVIFLKLLGSDCNICETLSSLEASAFRRFESVMADHAKSMQNYAHQLPSDLRVPDYLIEALTHFQSLVKSFDSSLATTTTHEEKLQRIMSLSVNPFLEVCRQQISGTKEPAHSIFLLNCLLATRAAFSGQDFVQKRGSQIEGQILICTTALVDYQHAYFLHHSGLHPLVAALALLPDESPQELSRIADFPSFQPTALRAASQRLDDFLPSALMDAMDNLKHLVNKHLSSEITAEAAERFCEEFDFVEGKLTMLDDMVRSDPGRAEEGRFQLRTIFPRTSGEIRVLLS